MRVTRANSYKQIFVDDIDGKRKRKRGYIIIFLILNCPRMTNFLIVFCYGTIVFIFFISFNNNLKI